MCCTFQRLVFSERREILPTDRHTHTQTDTQTDYRMPRGSAHRGITRLQAVKEIGREKSVPVILSCNGTLINPLRPIADLGAIIDSTYSRRHKKCKKCSRKVKTSLNAKDGFT